MQIKTKSIIREEAHFQILRLLHENPELTQRELGERVGVSLVSVNFCLRALIDRGFLETKNFRSSKNKTGHVYLLTPGGIAEKSLRAAGHLQRELGECAALWAEIDQLSSETAGLRD